MKLQGLYAVTDARLCAGMGVEAAVREALEGGARAIQYRDKGGDRVRRRREAEALVTLCGEYGVPLIVNDDVPLAAAAGAAGVHLGRGDMAIAQARRLLGATVIIGVSCYADLQRAHNAVAEGADYVAFGRFFVSATKPGAAPAPLELLREAHRVLSVPVVAIGGITPENGRQLVAAGADMLAVVQSVFGQPDVRAASRLIADLFILEESPS
ncbi:MAG: thiamine phosphate synthase [Pseudomonadota bacterium]